VGLSLALKFLGKTQVIGIKTEPCGASEVLGGFELSVQELAAKNCVSCEGVKPMTRRRAEQSLRGLHGWVLHDHTIEKEFPFSSYLNGLDFAYGVGKIAEKQDHHPDILIRWRKVKVSLSTHSIKGLSQNDFIIAAKAELKYRDSGFG